LLTQYSKIKLTRRREKGFGEGGFRGEILGREGLKIIIHYISLTKETLRFHDCTCSSIVEPAIVIFP
jgi:hypothetical protein